MEERKQDSQIYLCPESGALGHSKSCAVCAGRGAALMLAGRVYVWAAQLSQSKIDQRHVYGYLRVAINAGLFIFGILGVLALAKMIFDAELTGLDVYKLIYIKNNYSLLWWLSLLVDMYLLYRISRESKPRAVIKKDNRQKSGAAEQRLVSPTESFWPGLGRAKAISIEKFFDQIAFGLIEDAWILASKLGHRQVTDIHIFSALLRNTDTHLVFSRLGKDHRQLIEKVKSALKSISAEGKPTVLGAAAKDVFLRAFSRAYENNSPKVRVTDLLHAAASSAGTVKEILYDMEIEDEQIADVLGWVDLHRQLARRYHAYRYLSRLKPKGAMNRAYTAVATPNLDRVAEDMTLYARAGGYELCVGRQAEIQSIFRLLEAEKLGVVLIGEPGVGKRTLVEGIAQLMVGEEVPEVFQDKRLVSLSVSALLAGAGHEGDVEARVIKVMHEITRSKNIILFVEDIHHLVGSGAGSGAAFDLAEAFAEQLQKRSFYVLATTTADNYRQFIERSSLAKALQPLVINEMSAEESIKVLEAKALVIEAQHKVYFSYAALEAAAAFSQKYLRDSALPEKAIKLIEQAALEVKNSRGERAIVEKSDVAELVSRLSKIPVTKISESESERLLHLEAIMHERIIGQEAAVKLVSAALRRARAELKEENRPLASFLFLGPTGVGKTEVAKTLARVYFGAEKNMIRMDMSEYQAADALAKLLGDSRTRRGGYLTEAVQQAPFSLVLLDEIEKAAQDILDVFLQILDDGRLTDASGRTIDFSNTIIIATSNAGSQFIEDSLKQKISLENIRSQLISGQLRNYFKPEFLNRFDGIVVFHPLEIGQVREIAGIFLGQLASRLAEQGIGFEVLSGAVDKLAEMGYDPSFGARPLRRVIQDNVEDKLAQILLEQKVSRRDKVILGNNLELSLVKAKKL